MAGRNWMPTGRVLLHAIIKGVKVFIDANAGRLGMDDGTRIGAWYKDVFCVAYNPYDKDFDLWEDPSTRTFMGTENLKAGMKAIIPLFRALYSLLRGNPLVTDADLAAMNLPKRPTYERRPSPVAVNPPAFDVETISSHRLRIAFYDEDSENKSRKPHGQHGVEIRWGFTDKPTVAPGDLPNTSFDTATPYVLSFSVEDIGKRIAFALRWSNTRSKKGPWSDIAFSFIP